MRDSYFRIFKGETVPRETLTPTMDHAAEILIWDGKIIEQKRLDGGSDLYSPRDIQRREQIIETRLAKVRHQLEIEYRRIPYNTRSITAEWEEGD